MPIKTRISGRGWSLALCGSKDPERGCGLRVSVRPVPFLVQKSTGFNPPHGGQVPQTGRLVGEEFEKKPRSSL